MKEKAPHVPAAFINAIAEEGTKAEAVQFLQETWNDYCEMKRQLASCRTDFDKALRESLEWRAKAETRLPEAVAKNGATPRTDAFGQKVPYSRTDLLTFARQLERELAEAKFRPIGDNHHNAVLCPYCNPLVNGSAAVSPLAKHEEKKAPLPNTGTCRQCGYTILHPDIAKKGK